jgi:antitoxin component YwqK of YwqJK toxin-antitoxin module
MNKIAILMCVILLVLTGCSGKKMRKEAGSTTGSGASNANKVSEQLVYRLGGLVLLKSDNMPLTGFLQRYDDKKGYLSEESYYVNGVLNGQSKSFNENGSLSSYSSYFNGEMNGQYENYYKDGSLSYQSYYKNGVNISNRSWYENGIKSSEKNYKNGEVNGKSISWYESGKLKSVSNYEEGKRIGWQREYTETGEVLYEVNLVNGNGKISYKLPGFDITLTEEYLDGKIILPENGKVSTRSNLFGDWGTGQGRWIVEKTFENGQLNGVFTLRNIQSKNIRSETNYKNGLKHGKKKNWHNNGQLSEEGQYENDLEHGVWQEWYENGKLKTLRTYNYGKEVSKKCWDESGKSINCN